jgi:hypothetical protein
VSCSPLTGDGLSRPPGSRTGRRELASEACEGGMQQFRQRQAVDVFG